MRRNVEIPNWQLEFACIVRRINVIIFSLVYEKTNEEKTK